MEWVGAGGQGFVQDAVAPDVLEGDAALVPAEVAGGDRSGAQGIPAPTTPSPAQASIRLITTKTPHDTSGRAYCPRQTITLPACPVTNPATAPERV